MNFVRCRAMVLALAACVGPVGCAARAPSPDSWVSSVLDGEVDLLAACRRVVGDEPSSKRAPATEAPPASADLAVGSNPRRQAIARLAAADGVVLASAVEPVTPETPELQEMTLGPPPSMEEPAGPLGELAPPNHATTPTPPATPCRDACCGCTSTCGTAPGPVDSACGACSQCLAGRQCKLLTRPDPGPPPMRYYPPMPPKFLPVPTQPVISPARMDAPYPWRGDVEMGFRPEVIFPARD
jgi:hypothetical protein